MAKRNNAPAAASQPTAASAAVGADGGKLEEPQGVSADAASQASAAASNPGQDASIEAEPADQGESVAEVGTKAEERTYPRKVRLYNNSGIELKCRVSGLLVQSGGMGEFVVQDEDHADAIRRSISQFAEDNFISFDKLVFQPV